MLNEVTGNKRTVAQYPRGAQAVLFARSPAVIASSLARRGFHASAFSNKHDDAADGKGKFGNLQFGETAETAEWYFLSELDAATTVA